MLNYAWHKNHFWRSEKFLLINNCCHNIGGKSVSGQMSRQFGLFSADWCNVKSIYRDYFLSSVTYATLLCFLFLKRKAKSNCRNCVKLTLRQISEPSDGWVANREEGKGHCEPLLPFPFISIIDLLLLGRCVSSRCWWEGDTK